MPNPIGNLLPGLIRHFARNDCDFVTTARKFLRERVPHLFHRAAHRWRHWKKRTENNRDFH
jgi:hypothetical protein